MFLLNRDDCKTKTKSSEWRAEVERDDLSAADKNLVSLAALEDSSKDVTFTSSAFNLKEGDTFKRGFQENS